MKKYALILLSALCLFGCSTANDEPEAPNYAVIDGYSFPYVADADGKQTQSLTLGRSYTLRFKDAENATKVTYTVSGSAVGSSETPPFSVAYAPTSVGSFTLSCVPVPKLQYTDGVIDFPFEVVAAE